MISFQPFSGAFILSDFHGYKHIAFFKQSLIAMHCTAKIAFSNRNVIDLFEKNALCSGVK